MKQGVLLLPLTAALLLLSIEASAQSSSSNEPPRPSADAWSGIQYGAITPSLYTGTLHLSVPLYTYSDPDFEIPISAEYATNGCLPNDKAGVLGVGWTLNAGGMITREVRGVPDDKVISQNISASHVEDVIGFAAVHDSLFTCSDMVAMPTSGLGFSGRGCVYYRYADWEDIFYDAEPDIFHFNFMGYTGTFHLDFGGEIQIYDTNVPPSSLRIETAFSPINGHSPITITTGDGYCYEFDGYYGHSHDNTEVSYDSGAGVIITWKLSRIIAPNGRVAEFNYTRGIGVRSLRPNTLCYNLGIINPGYYDTQQYSNEKGYSSSEVITADLTSISIDQRDLVRMTYAYTQEKSYLNGNENPNLCLTTYGNTLLQTLSVTNGQDTVRSCTFNYTNANPAQRNFLTDITISGEGTYLMQYLNTSSIPMYCTFKVDHWGYYNGQTSPKFLNVSTLSADTYDETLNATSSRTPNASYAQYGTLSKITYPTGGYSTFTYEGHTYGKAIHRPHSFDFYPLLTTESGSAGGVRVKRINHYNSNNTLLDWRSYDYTENNESTGILVWVPRYKIQYSSTNPIGVEEFGTMMSNNLSHYGSTHIEYAAVTENRPDGSSIRYRYTSSLDYTDMLIYENGAPEQYFYVNQNSLPEVYPWTDATNDISKIFFSTSMQAFRGREKAIEMRNSAGDVVATDTTTFVNVLPDVDLVYTPQYLLHYTYDVGIYIGREDIGTHTQSRVYGSQPVSTTTAYSYNGLSQRLSQTVTGSRGEQQITRWAYTSFYSTAPITNMYRKMYDAGQIDRPVCESIYTKAPGATTETLLLSRTWTYSQPDAVGHPDLFCATALTEHDAISNTDHVTSYIYYKTGRIVQKTDPSCVCTAYVWGYDGLYPVAEIVGAGINSIQNAHSSLSNILNAPVSGSLSAAAVSAIQGLGDATVWEYSPLVGLTKETTPDGRSTTYTYNATGKLHQVLNDLSHPTDTYLYSTDNRQQ